jgi:hypothetical protein
MFQFSMVLKNEPVLPVVFRSLSQIMSLEREVEEGREKDRQLERERHDMERQINARSETFLHFTHFLWIQCDLFRVRMLP